MGRGVGAVASGCPFLHSAEDLPSWKKQRWKDAEKGRKDFAQASWVANGSLKSWGWGGGVGVGKSTLMSKVYMSQKHEEQISEIQGGLKIKGKWC